MECGVIIMNYTNSKKYWTEEDRNTVLQMDIDGYTQHEIAKHIGRSYNSVRHVMATEEYKRNKEMTLNKLALSKTFEQGTVYTIEEMKDLSGIIFLPSNFVYEGKT
jgi:transcriptional regulator